MCVPTLYYAQEAQNNHDLHFIFIISVLSSTDMSVFSRVNPFKSRFPGSWFKKTLFVIVILMNSEFVHAAKEPAADEIDFFFVYLPGLLEKDGITGPLAEVIHEVGSRARVVFNMHNLPIKRQDRELRRGKAVVVGPQLDRPSADNINTDLRSSVPLAFRRDFAFVIAGTPIPRAIEEIKEMVLVTTPTTMLPPPLARLEGLTIIETHSNLSAINLLSKGRVDLWVNDKTITLDAIKGAGVANITYNPNKPYYQWPARLIYSETVSPNLVAKIDAAILSMVGDGTLKAMLPNNFTDNYDTSPLH